MFLTNEDGAKIERIAAAMFTQQRDLAQVPRMAAGVVVNGSLVSFFGHNASENSLFRIASMTKSFTAAAVLLLRDEGVLRLDAPVGEYAPEFTGLRGPTADAPMITVRHLLTMSSGLCTDDPWADRHLDISDDDLDLVVLSNPLFAEGPGTSFEYSNLGYGILGRVIHRVSRLRPQAFISERLLKPLGMTHTVWESADAPEGTDVVIGMRADVVAPECAPLDGGLATMGGLWSTAADLAKWTGFFTDAYPARDDEDAGLLKRSSRREMQCIHTFVESHNVTTSDGTHWNANGGYGMGLLINQDKELGEVVGHSGGLPGYGSNMRWVKGTGFGVVALGNATYTPMAAATRRALDALSAAHVVRKPTVAASPTLTQAGASLVELLLHWEGDKADEQARSLFADNVEPDSPFAERRDNAAAMRAKHGELHLSRIEATSAAAGKAIMHSAQGEVTVTFSLSPLHLIQKYDLPKEFADQDE